MTQLDLSPADRDRIIDLRLNRVPIRAICAEMDLPTPTVADVWQEWLEESAAKRSESVATVRAEAIARLERIATDARIGAASARKAGLASIAARCLGIERAAVMDAAKLDGFTEPPPPSDEAKAHAAQWLATWLGSDVGLLLSETDRLALERACPFVASYWQHHDPAALVEIERAEGNARKRANVNRYRPTTKRDDL